MLSAEDYVSLKLQMMLMTKAEREAVRRKLKDYLNLLEEVECQLEDAGETTH